MHLFSCRMRRNLVLLTWTGLSVQNSLNACCRLRIEEAENALASFATLPKFRHWLLVLRGDRSTRETSIDRLVSSSPNPRALEKPVQDHRQELQRAYKHELPESQLGIESILRLRVLGPL